MRSLPPSPQMRVVAESPAMMMSLPSVPPRTTWSVAGVVQDSACRGPIRVRIVADHQRRELGRADGDAAGRIGAADQAPQSR